MRNRYDFVAIIHLTLIMDINVNTENYLRSIECRPKYKHVISRSLIGIIKHKNVDINDIMKWCWQIAEYGKYLHERKNQCLDKFNINTIRIDDNNDIVATTIFSRKQRCANDNMLLRASYILDYTNSIIEYTLINNKNNINIRKFKLLNILMKHEQLSSKLNLMNNAVLGSWHIIDVVCELVEDGIIDNINSVF